MRKILITGGAGFIGSHIAEHYARKGDDVIVLDNFSRAILLGSEERFAHFNWNFLKAAYPGIRLIRADVRDAAEVKRCTEGVDIIVHCAGQTAVTTSMLDPRTDFECNTVGTINVLEAARESANKPALVFCSTNKVYGENVNKIKVAENGLRYCFADQAYARGIPETLPLNNCCHTPYGCSKLAADVYIQDYGHYYNFKTGVFRLSCIYGDRQFGLEDQGWVAHFAITSVLGRPITIYGDGKQVRDILHVADVVEAFDRFIEADMGPDVFNLGGGVHNSVSLLELIDLLERILGKKIPLVFKPERPSDQKVYISDVSKAHEMLNWQPSIDMADGVGRLVKWVVDNRHLF
jgi:CDP-paratose 2-epimerase